MYGRACPSEEDTDSQIISVWVDVEKLGIPDGKEVRFIQFFVVLADVLERAIAANKHACIDRNLLSVSRKLGKEKKNLHGISPSSFRK